MFFIDDYVKRLCSITRDCRPDMHEPDEQELSMELHYGFGFDNAYMGPPEQTRMTDAGFWLIKDKGRPTEQREWFNLACIIAIVRHWALNRDVHP